MVVNVGSTYGSIGYPGYATYCASKFALRGFSEALRRELADTDHRHTNTESDSEVLLNVLAHELARSSQGSALRAEDVFAAVRAVHQRVKGSYAVAALIAGYGLVAFRDPYGIRPLCMGRAADGAVMLASESVSESTKLAKRLTEPLASQAQVFKLTSKMAVATEA